MIASDASGLGLEPREIARALWRFRVYFTRTWTRPQAGASLPVLLARVLLHRAIRDFDVPSWPVQRTVLTSRSAVEILRRFRHFSPEGFKGKKGIPRDLSAKLGGPWFNDEAGRLQLAVSGPLHDRNARSLYLRVEWSPLASEVPILPPSVVIRMADSVAESARQIEASGFPELARAIERLVSAQTGVVPSPDHLLGAPVADEHRRLRETFIGAVCAFFNADRHRDILLSCDMFALLICLHVLMSPDDEDAPGVSDYVLKKMCRDAIVILLGEAEEMGIPRRNEPDEAPLGIVYRVLDRAFGFPETPIPDSVAPKSWEPPPYDPNDDDVPF